MGQFGTRLPSPSRPPHGIATLETGKKNYSRIGLYDGAFEHWTVFFSVFKEAILVFVFSHQKWPLEKWKLQQKLPHNTTRTATNMRDVSRHIYEWVMSHIWMSHVSYMNESCLTYEWVMSHVWMSHVSHTNDSMCPTYEKVMDLCRRWAVSPVWMRHVSYMNESCLTYECVMSYVWISHVSYTNDSISPIYHWVLDLCRRWALSPIWMRHI